MTESEKKANKNNKIKKMNFFKNWDDKLVALKNFIVSNPDYIIFLVMMIVSSLMYEPYGFTRTLPLVLVAAFFLGTFFGYRKRIMIHLVIGLLIITSVSQDFALSAHIILTSVFLTFAGIYVAKYLETFKKQNIFRKIINGIISIVLVALALFTYVYRFGSPISYMNSKKIFDEYVTKNDYHIYVQGIAYDYTTRSYNLEYIEEDKITENKLVYNTLTKEVYTNEEFENLLNDEVNKILEEDNVVSAENSSEVIFE